jgi:hypothetical protein
MRKTEEKEKYWVELVLAKLSVMPAGYKLSVGDKGTFSKVELIDHVSKRDSIGKQIIDMQISFTKALTSGELTRLMTS